MKKLPIVLLLFLLAATGCTTTRSSDWPFPDRRDRGRHDTRRADPVVGRTTDGRRIYEDRRSGRVYTLDHRGRRVYQERDPRDRRYEDRRSDDRRGKGHSNGHHRGKGRKEGHRKHHRH